MEEFQFLKRKIKIINKNEEDYGEERSRERDEEIEKRKTL